jgi:predicted RNase H-like HicB family nuclease
MTHAMKFTVALERQPEGGYTVQCIELPGAISQGETRREALANIQDAILLVLEVRREEAARRSGAHLETVEVDA